MSDKANETPVEKPSAWSKLFAAKPKVEASVIDSDSAKPEVGGDQIPELVSEPLDKVTELVSELAEPLAAVPSIEPPSGLLPPIEPPSGLLPPPTEFFDPGTPAAVGVAPNLAVPPVIEPIPEVKVDGKPESENGYEERDSPAELVETSVTTVNDESVSVSGEVPEIDETLSEPVSETAESPSEESVVEPSEVLAAEPAPSIQPGVKLPKTLVGPLAWVALVVAIGWLAVGGVVLTLMSGTVAWIIGGVAIAAGLITAYIGLTMTAKVSGKGVKVPFAKLNSWDDIVGVRVVPMVGWGNMTAPMLEVADGRAIKEVELEGLASLGKGAGALKRAEIIAAAGNLSLDGDEPDDEEPEFTPRRAM